MSDMLSNVRVSPFCYVCEFEGESILLDEKAGKFYRLNKVAAFVFRLIENNIQVCELSARVAEEFSVSQDECSPDITELLANFQDAGIILVGR